MSFNPMVQFVSTGKETLFGIMEASREKSYQSLEAVKALCSKTKEFVTVNGSKVSLAVGSAILIGAPNSANAADPAWYTDLTTQLISINNMVVAVLGTVIAIALAPLAWTYVKRVLSRG